MVFTSTCGTRPPHKPWRRHQSECVRYSPAVGGEGKKELFCIREPEEIYFLGVQSKSMGSKPKLLGNKTCVYTGELEHSNQYQKKEVFQYVKWTTNERTMDTGSNVTIFFHQTQEKGWKANQRDPLICCICCWQCWGDNLVPLKCGENKGFNWNWEEFEKNIHPLRKGTI